MIDRFQPMKSLPLLFTMDDLEAAFQWISTLRKKHSPNSDIWRLRRDWKHIKDGMLTQLNDGSYQFSLLDRLEFEDATISLWCSQDMIVLKLISQTLGQQMAGHIPKSCYHVKGHGGLKKGVADTFEALAEHQHVMRSDIKGYYSSIRFDVLIEIIQSYVKHPILLTLIGKACRRTETRGGVFYDFNEKGIPKGSPLSPILGAIALIPLDKAMGQVKGIFYARFMDDWVVLTKSKTALRKIVKITHEVVQNLKLQLHPSKTYIGKISHGFNFLAYYMDNHKILPSKETIRRFHERAAALYEPSHTGKNISRRYHKTVAYRDISEYHTNEAAPTDEYFRNTLMHLLSLAARIPDTLATTRQYIGKWACWLKLGLSSIEGFEHYVLALLPSVFSCWTPAPKVLTLGDCR